VSGLPLPVALALAYLGGRIAARRQSDRDAVVRANLARVVGTVPPEEMDRLVERAFVEYARYWILAARLAGGLVRHPTRYVSIVGRERIVAARARGGVIFAVPHLGLWDAGGLVSMMEGFSIATVAEEASTPELTAWFEKQRRRLGLTSYPPSPATTTTLLDLLRGGGAVALVADRDVVGDGIVTPFFGAPTRVPAGPVVLALRSDATLLPSAVFLRPHGRIEVVIGEPLMLDRRGRLRDDVARLTEDLVGRYEEFIRSAPEQWHVFQPIWTDEVVPPADPAPIATAPIAARGES
jgi:phosphatidylinositol dimannoside acyltransferase